MPRCARGGAGAAGPDHMFLDWLPARALICAGSASGPDLPCGVGPGPGTPGREGGMTEAETPVVWGDFEVHFDRLLGRGGMGSVYEARQISLDRKVALKVLDTDRAPTPELREGFLGKFNHEAKALAKLNDPRIVTILQAGSADGKCWYAMERVEGCTVDQRITEKGAFEPKEAARIAAEVARALSAAL